MTKEQLEELQMLSKLMDNPDAIAIVEQITKAFDDAGGAPEVPEEEYQFTEPGLVKYMNEKVVKVIEDEYQKVDNLNRRKLSTAYVKLLFTKEQNDKKYLIEVKPALKKKKKIDGIMIPFVKAINDSIEDEMYFEDLMVAIINAAKGYKTQDYIDQLANYEWKQAYKNESLILTPNWKDIYKKICEFYENNYQLTEEAYKEGIQEWIDGTKQAVKSKSYDEYEVDLEELHVRIENYFKGRPNLFTVYPDLKKSVLEFFSSENLGSNGAIIENEGRKYITLVSLQNCIVSNFNVSAPTFNENDRITIKSNQRIPEDLGANDGYPWLADALSNSIEENSPKYMEDAIEQLMIVDEQNVKERIRGAITLWRNDIVTLLKGLKDDNVPRINEIGNDLKNIFNNCVPLSGELCSDLLSEINVFLGNGQWDTLKKLSQEFQENIFKNDPKYDIKEVLKLWWGLYDGNFTDITAEMLAAKCLPLPASVVDALERNVSVTTKSTILNGIKKWKQELQDPFQNAAAGLSSFANIKTIKFKLKDFKETYLDVLFDQEESGSLEYFKAAIGNTITGTEPVTSIELDTLWNKGIAAIDPQAFWDEYLFKAYVEDDYNGQILDAWSGDMPLTLPHSNRFVALLIKLLLKLPVRKRPKKPTQPTLKDNRTLDGYLELFDKWGETYLTQGEQIGKLLERYYHIFDTVIATNIDVQNDFDRFIDQCNSDLEALYDNSWLSGTLGTVATVGIVLLAAPEIAALTAAAAAASLVTATAAKVAGEVVTGAVELISPTPSKYASESNGVFKSLASIDQGIDEMGSATMGAVIKSISKIRTLYRSLIQLKIKNIALTDEMIVKLNEVDAAAVAVYNLLITYIDDFDKELSRVKLTNIYTTFEGYILKDFILKKVKEPGEDILESSVFKNKLISHNFCTEDDFVDHTLWYDSWVEDHKRLMNAVYSYNPGLFGF